MYWFLIPISIGFTCNWASAFTRFLCKILGERRGQLAGFVLRNILGIPLWVAGLVMAMKQPAVFIFTPAGALGALSWLLLLLGTVLMLLGMQRLGLRTSRPTTHDTLVCSGIFRHVRHPIYSGLLVDFIALALQHPTKPVILACALGWLYVHVQARLEEIDLRQRIPGYGEYMKAVPRFFPCPGRKWER